MIRSRRPVSPEDVGGHYDELDRFYRVVWGAGLHHGLWAEGGETPEEAVVALVERLGREAEVGPGTRVCDVGCGYGQPARILAERFGARVTGLTLSSRQAEVAGSLPVERGPTPEFRRGDFLRMDLGPGSFDVVMALESTAHMEDKAGFFNRAEAILVPGGRLVVAAWTASEPLAPWQEHRLLEPICRYGRLPGLGTSNEYASWCRRAGLAEVETTDLTSKVRRTWSIVLRRIPVRLLPRPSTWRFLLDSGNRHRDFLLAIPLIWLAQRMGSLRYTLLTATKPTHEPPPRSPFS